MDSKYVCTSNEFNKKGITSYITRNGNCCEQKQNIRIGNIVSDRMGCKREIKWQPFQLKGQCYGQQHTDRKSRAQLVCEALTLAPKDSFFFYDTHDITEPRESYNTALCSEYGASTTGRVKGFHTGTLEI